MEFAVRVDDRMLVDAGDAAPHQPVGIELPVFVPIGPEPGAAVVVELVGKAHGDAVSPEGPEFLDQAIVELARPLALEEGFYGFAALEELGAIAPLAVRRVGQRDLRRIAAVPAILGKADLLGRGLLGEGRQGRTGHASLSRLR